MVKRFKKFFKNFGKNFSLSKREKFGLIVGLLTLGLLLIQLSTSFRFQMIGVLVILSYILCAWGLREELTGIEWLLLFILPVMYPAAVTLFYFLLPVRWLTRAPTAAIFAVGMYAILLVENIYNVAAERTIQLIRAAHSVGLLMTLFTTFLLLNVIFSLHLTYLQNGLLVFAISLPLAMQSLWVTKLEERISGELLLFTLVISLTMGELAFVFSFWPIQVVLEALFLTTVFYTLVGISQQHFLERLFQRAITEFISVSIIVFILVLMTTKWG